MSLPSYSNRNLVDATAPAVVDETKEVDLGATGTTIASVADRSPSSDSDDLPPVWHAATTVIIFDWDDTLLPSSHLTHLGLDLFDPHTPGEIAKLHANVSKDLDEIDQVAADLLETASDLGRVAIVTNAEKGWVELSASRFLPRTYLALLRLNVPTVSARTRFSTADSSASEWKLLAFVELLAGQPAPPLNVLSFGDSECERYALFNTVTSPALPKSFKFLEGPSASTLLVELRWIAEIIVRMTKQNGCLDLMFNYNRPGSL